jgi:hypothetical protein
MSEPQPTPAEPGSPQPVGTEPGPAEPIAKAAVASKPLLDADGRERPHFVTQLPKHPALDALVDAFERGDFGYVRAQAPALLSSATEPDVKQAITELRRRIDPDPTVKLLLALAVLTFGFLAAWAYLGR